MDLLIITHVQITHGCSLASPLGCFEAAKTSSLTALIGAKGVSDNRPSGSGKL